MTWCLKTSLSFKWLQDILAIKRDNLKARVLQEYGLFILSPRLMIVDISIADPQFSNGRLCHDALTIDVNLAIL